MLSSSIWFSERAVVRAENLRQSQHLSIAANGLSVVRRLALYQPPQALP